MYDERTRMIEQQLAANESARIRGEQSGMEIGMRKGIEQGRAEGQIQALTKMVRDGHLTKEVAAQGLELSVEEFEKYL